MDYKDFGSNLKIKVKEIREHGKNTLEFAVGFSNSFLVVGGTYWATPTMIRKLLKYYEDNEIHKYLLINKRDSKSRGMVVGTAAGFSLWTLAWGFGVAYSIATENSIYLLAPLATNTISAGFEIRRFMVNRRKKEGLSKNFKRI